MRLGTGSRCARPLLGRPREAGSSLLEVLLAASILAGGVLLVWWDAEHGLRLNPAVYPSADEGQGWGE